MKQMIHLLTRYETSGTFSRYWLAWGPCLQPSFEQQLSGSYSTLSIKLKAAADYVVSHPVDVATRSLRSISKEAKLSPATFSRMSNALGYESYEDLREVLRRSMKSQPRRFAERVDDLQQRHNAGDLEFGSQHIFDCTTNIQDLSETVHQPALEETVGRLHEARRVLVFGGLGSTGVAEYLTYMASFIADNWSMASRMGASLSSGLVGMDERDVLIIVTKPPFASKAVNAAQEAREAGVFVVVITDTHTCPALEFASVGLNVPTQSQHFFSSFAATVVLAEIMIGKLASRMGASARERIAKVEDRYRRLGEVWDG